MPCTRACVLPYVFPLLMHIIIKVMRCYKDFAVFFSSLEAEDNDNEHKCHR